MDNPAIIVLHQDALSVAQKIKVLCDGEIHALAGRVDGADTTFTNTKDHIRTLFRASRPIIAIMASGAIIRLLAPLLEDKTTEPPIISIDEGGKHVVPLLGGHHGANRLSTILAQGLDATAAITTAGEGRFHLALDDPPEGWVLANPQHSRIFMANLLSGASVTLTEEDCRADWLRDSTLPFTDNASLRIKATIYKETGDESTLIYHPKILVLGMGCERGVDSSPTIALAEKILNERNLSPHSLSTLTSIDLKADETALHDTARHLNIPIRFFDAATLEQESSRLPNPSTVVFNEVGCHGVCEGAALASVGSTGKLLIEKVKSKDITAALAITDTPINPNKIGRARGHLSIIGIGPGHDDWCSPEVTRLVSQSQDLVGYTLYIDLLGDKATGKEIHNFPLGREEDRVLHALELAGSGRNVSLVCSGDAGIYAMACLVFESLDKSDKSDKSNLSPCAHRISIRVAPGISALQAAAARSGAPLGHDFCTISLSDLLTPWSAIERRIESAATGDFVIAFYNPVSQRRRHQLAKAKEILLTARPPRTPVILASNLGRDGEKITMTTLEDLRIDDVDMLTLVIVGSSETQSMQDGSGKNWIYTPRGYGDKASMS